MTLVRSPNNPFLQPNPMVSWESRATFNPCVVKRNSEFHILYRAIGDSHVYHGKELALSTIGHAISHNGTDFENRQQFIKPDYDWEKFGCEDPRVTFFEGKYYIFYTALSEYPFHPRAIRVGLAITSDFVTIEEKQLITPFNAKAMALFSERINGKIVAILTVNTDIPPAKIAVAYFDTIEELWSVDYWNKWYQTLDDHVIPLLRNRSDHVEVGAPPIKTDLGWLLLYCYIQNYFSNAKRFGIETVLLDLKDPSMVIGKSTSPLLIPEENYELYGDVPNIAFPSGALIERNTLYLYYGAADTTCCYATADIKKILDTLTIEKKRLFIVDDERPYGFQRYVQNPIITPRFEMDWEVNGTLNPGVIYLDGYFHLIYRAMSSSDISTFGYAKSRDGLNITERATKPIYQPRADFEKKLCSGASGCEDPRITKLDDTIYMFYTAFDGYTPRVAYTTISVDDFLHQRWSWSYPKVITSPGTSDKNACLLPKKVNGKYVIFHRMNDAIYINYEDDLNFGPNNWLSAQTQLVRRRSDYQTVLRYGVVGPPIETRHGWILFYHFITREERIYKIGAMLLDSDNPSHIISLSQTLIEPKMSYEKQGVVPNVVFSCGSILLEESIYLYYGAADSVICVAKISLTELIKQLS
ncbi:MAG: hypothetical protein NTW94_00475 [Legionellales bacterium]|nr:hypothetical protein [Legionellales bacterium]